MAVGEPKSKTRSAVSSGPLPEPLQPQDPTVWVDRYGDMLLSYALSRIRQREIAEDLVQETFLVAWKTRKDFAGRSLFSTWLVSILRHKIADHFRRESGRAAQSLDSWEDWQEAQPPFTKRGKWSRAPKAWSAAPDELAENREFWRTVAGCLGEMPAHLAYVFRLRELKSAKTKDICTLLDISSSNVSVRLHRARLLLRKCLEDKWFE
ncbi:MAG: sigma-70 family RNA polymerase sigma factor [Planctomycetales bacterium]|nr:sigma-70 family RNA polymerase sigma factor [Planctomycetales bacterium]